MDKSEVMIVGSGDMRESKIAGFEVEKEIKYLGVWIDDHLSIRGV